MMTMIMMIVQFICLQAERHKYRTKNSSDDDDDDDSDDNSFQFIYEQAERHKYLS